jgi:hypothetical protein
MLYQSNKKKGKLKKQDKRKERHNDSDLKSLKP